VTPSLVAEVLGDGGAYDVRLFKHILVSKAKNGEALLSQEVLTFIVVFVAGGIVVHRAVQFDDYLLGGAVEIDDVRTDAVLSAKLATAKLAFPQHAPQRTFGWRSGVTQALAMLLEVLAIVERRIRHGLYWVEAASAC